MLPDPEGGFSYTQTIDVSENKGITEFFYIDSSTASTHPNYYVDEYRGNIRVESFRLVRAVPEPGSLALLAVAGAAFTWTQSRRREVKGVR